MLAGTGNLKQLVSVAQSPSDFKQQVEVLMQKAFNEDELIKRQTYLKPFDNEPKTRELISIIHA
jgi:hypothetical protein